MKGNRDRAIKERNRCGYNILDVGSDDAAAEMPGLCREAEQLSPCCRRIVLEDNEDVLASWRSGVRYVDDDDNVTVLIKPRYAERTRTLQNQERTKIFYANVWYSVQTSDSLCNGRESRL